MKNINKTTAVEATTIREAIARVDAYRALSADKLEGLKANINNAVAAYGKTKTDDEKKLARLEVDKTISEYNSISAMLTMKQLNGSADALDTFLSFKDSGAYDSAKFSRGAVNYTPSYITASQWAGFNAALEKDYIISQEDMSEKAKEAITIPTIIPQSLVFQGALEVLELMCVRSLDFVSVAPSHAIEAPKKPTSAEILSQVNKVAELITGKNEDLYAWAAKAVVTFSAQYRAKKRIVKGASDSDYINLIFDIIRQKRVKIDGMAYASKASIFREKK